MKVLITGQSGSGKTTILKELETRGYTTYNTDDMPGITQLEIQATGEPADWPEGYIDWSYYAWKWQDKAIRKILAGDGTMFVGAIVGNQADYYPLFDQVFALTVNDAELYKRRTGRLEQRKSDYPKNVEESVARNQKNTAQFISAGATALANDRPVSLVVDDLLDSLKLPKSAPVREDAA